MWLFVRLAATFKLKASNKKYIMKLCKLPEIYGIGLLIFYSMCVNWFLCNRILSVVKLEVYGFEVCEILMKSYFKLCTFKDFVFIDSDIFN